MKKIGLVTLYKNNYGSIIQCYSTKTFLEKMGYECIVLSYAKKENNALSKMLKMARILWKSARYQGYLEERVSLRHIMKTESTYLSKESFVRMNRFVEDYLCPVCYSWRDLCDLGKNSEFIAFVVGSDQVWNVGSDIEPFYFLKFVNKRKRIAFAVSLGVETMPDFCKSAVKRGVRGFDSISVREESGKVIINGIEKVKTERIADPTILFSDDKWREFYHGSSIPTEPYIFVHFLNRPSELAINAINWLSKKMDCSVVCFAYNYDDWRLVKRELFMDGSPNDYVALIDNAKAICTDSFHTILFAINFHNKFFAFHRQYLHKHPQTSRITDLLARYRLENRLITQLEGLYNIFDKQISDYSLTLDSERRAITEYLINKISEKEK